MCGIPRPVTGAYQKSHSTHAASHFDVSRFVSDYNARTGIKAKITRRPLQQSQSRLSASTFVIRRVGAKIDAVNRDPLGPEQLLHSIVNVLHRGFVEKSAPDTRLIRDNYQAVA